MGLSGRFDRKMRAVELEIPARSDRPARLQLERRRLRGTGGGRRATPHGSPGPFTAPHGPSRSLKTARGSSRPLKAGDPSRSLTAPHGPSRPLTPGAGTAPGGAAGPPLSFMGISGSGRVSQGGNRTNSAEAQGEIRQPVLGGAMLGAPGLRQRG